MMTTGHNPIRVLVFDASLRAGSLNDRLAALAASVVEQFAGAVDRARITQFDCPSYDADVEKSDGIPPGAEQLRKRLETADAFLIASPEYNASMPGGLKNVIDWVSRAKPQPFNGKQGLLRSASPSMAGGNRGLWSQQHAIRRSRSNGSSSSANGPMRPSTGWRPHRSVVPNEPFLEVAQ